MFAIPLKLTHLIKDLWFLDGTFRVVREPFIQLLSSHSFIKSWDEMKQVPLCFVLMTRQKKIDYSVIRTIIGLLSTEPAVEEIIVDFERVVWATFGWCIPTDTVLVSMDTSNAVYRGVEDYVLRSLCTSLELQCIHVLNI